MIKLINVSKYFVTPSGRHYVFRDVNLELPLDRNIGVIGPNGAGKSTFLRLLAGSDHPSTGVVLKSGRISPPMGLTPVLQKQLSALENVRFAGRIYGMKKEEIENMITYVRDLAKIGKYFEMPVYTYSSGMKQKVAFGINMSMQFDYYLFDEISAGGDREFKKVAKAMVAERLRTSRFVMTSHDTSELLELCNAGIVIKDGTLTYFDDVKEAAIFYGDEIPAEGSRKSRRKQRRKRKEAEPESADSMAGTISVDEAPDERKPKRKRRSRKDKAEVVSAENDDGAIIADVPAGKEDSKRKRRARKEKGDAASTENADSVVSADVPESELKSKRKQRSRKEKANAVSVITTDGTTAMDVPASEKKSRRKRRRGRDNSEAVSAPSDDGTVAADLSAGELKPKRKRRNRKESAQAAGTMDAEGAMEIDAAETEQKTKRKLRRKKKKAEAANSEGADGTIPMEAAANDRKSKRKRRNGKATADIVEAEAGAGNAIADTSLKSPDLPGHGRHGEGRANERALVPTGNEVSTPIMSEDMATQQPGNDLNEVGWQREDAASELLQQGRGAASRSGGGSLIAGEPSLGRSGRSAMRRHPVFHPVSEADPAPGDHASPRNGDPVAAAPLNMRQEGERETAGSPRMKRDPRGPSTMIRREFSAITPSSQVHPGGEASSPSSHALRSRGT